MMCTPISASALDTKQAEGYARGIVTYEKHKNGIPEGDSLLSGRISEDAGYDSSDWLAIGAVRSGLEKDTSEYFSVWKMRIEDEYSDDTAIDRLNATDWHRAVLTGICLGANPNDISDVDLLGRGTYLRGEGRPLDAQGLNGEIWALIAMDSCDWKLPEGAKPDRTEIIQTIINSRNSDGGFSLTVGDGRSDPDITAMALQALSPYRCCEETEDTVARAVDYLAESQSDTDNCETTAQIIMTKPDETLFRPGTKAKRQLKRTAVSITLSTAIFFLATGIIMAMNIPYIAIPRASLMAAGSIFPATAPTRVPAVHPMNGVSISPYI